MASQFFVMNVYCKTCKYFCSPFSLQSSIDRVTDQSLRNCFDRKQTARPSTYVFGEGKRQKAQKIGARLWSLGEVKYQDILRYLRYRAWVQLFIDDSQFCVYQVARNPVEPASAYMVFNQLITITIKKTRPPQTWASGIGCTGNIGVWYRHMQLCS